MVTKQTTPLIKNRTWEITVDATTMPIAICFRDSVPVQAYGVDRLNGSALLSLAPGGLWFALERNPNTTINGVQFDHFTE